MNRVNKAASSRKKSRKCSEYRVSFSRVTEKHNIVNASVHSSEKTYAYVWLLFMVCTIKSSVCKEFTHLSIMIKDFERLTLYG